MKGILKVGAVIGVLLNFLLLLPEYLFGISIPASVGNIIGPILFLLGFVISFVIWSNQDKIRKYVENDEDVQLSPEKPQQPEIKHQPFGMVSENTPYHHTIIWKQLDEIIFSIPDFERFRTLKLIRVFHNSGTQMIYFHTFCFAADDFRTWKMITLGDEIFVNNKKYSMNDFCKKFLGFSVKDLEKSFTIDYSMRNNY